VDTSSASSIAPSILALPPVSTMPAAISSSKPPAPQLLAHQPEQLLVARLDDLGERSAARGGAPARSPTLGTSMPRRGGEFDSAHA